MSGLSVVGRGHLLNPVQERLPDRYRIIEEVGQGGMAVVYRAQDQTLGRQVAVKLLHAHLVTEPESKTRLEREAQAVAKLQHDNVVQIYDYSGSASPTAFIVTEFIEGETLKQFLARRTIPFPELAALIVIEVGTALQHAHQLGILHRDVKPENVMVRKDGLLKLMDFGVAQIVDLERMTVTGQLLGSPAYMAPELIEGKPVDFRTDVFSLGIMLYQLATGTLPFTGRNPHEVFKRIADARFTDPRTLNPKISNELVRIIAKALARRPDDRFASAAALVEDLRGYVAPTGLKDARAELRAFFAGEQGQDENHAQGLAPRLLMALLASARRASAEGKTACALELLNRAAGIDPTHADIQRALRRLQGRRWLRRLGLAVAGMAMLLALVLVLGPYLHSKTPTLPTPKSDRSNSLLHGPMVPQPTAIRTAVVAGGAAATPGASAATPTKLAQGEGHRESVKPRPQRAREATLAPAPSLANRAAETEAARVRFSLGVTPQRAEVWLDGRKTFDYGPNHNEIEIDWDRSHIIELRNPCCFPARFVVGPNDARPVGDRLTARLEGKPATLVLQVSLRPEGQEAKVQDVTFLISEAEMYAGVGPRHWPAVAGQSVQIPFDRGDELRKSLVVTAQIGSQGAINETISVAAGEKSIRLLHPKM